MNNLDQFYTNINISKMLFNIVKNKINIKEYFLFEPSAGNGAFSDLFKENKLNFEAIDLEPKKDYIKKRDFLSYNTENLLNKKVITIGNPPFGKNSSLALKFINKAAIFSDYICFILPKTFLKSSMINKINNNLHLNFNQELPQNSFIFNNKIYDVPCVFQIWKKENYKRINITKKIQSIIFDFTTPENADFAIRRVGKLAGKVIIDFNNYKPASHYYIKSKIDKNELILLIQSKFSEIQNIAKNTAGNPSIAKGELIEIIENKYKENWTGGGIYLEK